MLNINACLTLWICCLTVPAGVRGGGVSHPSELPGGFELAQKPRKLVGCEPMPLIQTYVSGFPEYHKIDTMFERNEQFVVNEDRLKKTVIGTISTWDVTEKIDGTNIRVMLAEDGSIQYGGRSDNAQIPADLIQTLMRTFSAESLTNAFWINGEQPVSVVLYGEGYGAGIQKGGGYRHDKAFILFDVLVGGKWWLDSESVLDVASKLGIAVVPYLGRMSLSEIVNLVRMGFSSRIGSIPAEGIVARPIETLYDKRGERLIIKLKTKDFKPGRR